jgi:hypothetical protein
MYRCPKIVIRNCPCEYNETPVCRAWRDVSIARFPYVGHADHTLQFKMPPARLRSGKTELEFAKDIETALQAHVGMEGFEGSSFFRGSTWLVHYSDLMCPHAVLTCRLSIDDGASYIELLPYTLMMGPKAFLCSNVPSTTDGFDIVHQLVK